MTTKEIWAWIQHVRHTPPGQLLLEWIGAGFEAALKSFLAGISAAAPTLATGAFVLCVLAFVLTHNRKWLGRAGLSFFVGLILVALGA